jgi:hypothetical protein
VGDGLDEGEDFVCAVSGILKDNFVVYLEK